MSSKASLASFSTNNENIDTALKFVKNVFHIQRSTCTKHRKRICIATATFLLPPSPLFRGGWEQRFRLELFF